MNFSTVKSISIPEGNVTGISVGGIKMWSGNSGGNEPELYSWEGVAYHINKGTYKDVYAIGDMVPLDLGSEGLINMQVVAFDADALADGSGTAAISWVSKNVLVSTCAINPTYSAGVEGTGSLGGWEKSALRAYLKDSIESLLPANVQNLVETVTKYSLIYNASGTRQNDVATEDRLWIPSRQEVSGYSETMGVKYEVFDKRTSLIRYKAGSSVLKSAWWLRTASVNTAEMWFYVNTSGVEEHSAAGNSRGVCIGFCTGKTKT